MHKPWLEPNSVPPVAPHCLNSLRKYPRHLKFHHIILNSKKHIPTYDSKEPTPQLQ